MRLRNVFEDRAFQFELVDPLHVIGSKIEPPSSKAYNIY